MIDNTALEVFLYAGTWYIAYQTIIKPVLWTSAINKILNEINSKVSITNG